MPDQNELRNELRKYTVEFGAPLRDLAAVFGNAIHQKNFIAAWSIADALPALKDLTLERMGGDPVDATKYQGIPEGLPAGSTEIMARIADGFGELLGREDVLGVKFLLVSIDQLRELFQKKLESLSAAC